MHKNVRVKQEKINICNIFSIVIHVNLSVHERESILLTTRQCQHPLAKLGSIHTKEMKRFVARTKRMQSVVNVSPGDVVLTLQQLQWARLRGVFKSKKSCLSGNLATFYHRHYYVFTSKQQESPILIDSAILKINRNKETDGETDRQNCIKLNFLM